MTELKKRRSKKKVSKRHADRIFDFIESQFGITKENLIGRNQSDDVCLIRMACYRHLKESKGYSQAAIAQVFQRDRSTIHNALSLFDATFKGEKARPVIAAFNQRRLSLGNETYI